MKLPEPLFAIINPLVTFLLRSPMHAFWSSHLMLISFTGRNSGRQFTTPVRYIDNDGVIRCFTSATNQWWRNLRGGAAVTLRLRGRDVPSRAWAIDDDPEEIRQWLRHYLAMFPQDAAYHEIRLNRDNSLVDEDLESASHRAVVVAVRPISQAAPGNPE